MIGVILEMTAPFFVAMAAPPLISSANPILNVGNAAFGQITERSMLSLQFSG